MHTMKRLSRKFFLKYLGLFGSAILFGRKAISSLFVNPEPSPVTIYGLNEGEDIFEYIRRTNGTMDITIYRQIIGSANPFKEGDETLGIAAKDESSRNNARLLLFRSINLSNNSRTRRRRDAKETENAYSWTKSAH